MWLLRRKARTPESEPDVLPPATVPMRRIEITVERHSISRILRSTGGEDEMPDALVPELARPAHLPALAPPTPGPTGTGTGSPNCQESNSIHRHIRNMKGSNS